jgi:hypothetical protein
MDRRKLLTGVEATEPISCGYEHVSHTCALTHAYQYSYVIINNS